MTIATALVASIGMAAGSPTASTALSPVAPTIREVVAPTPGTDTSFGFVTSSAVAVGDLLVLGHAYDYYTAADMLPPTGAGGAWTQRGTTGDAGSLRSHIKGWTRVVSTAGVQTINCNSVTNDGSHMPILVVVNGASDFVTVEGAAGGSGTASTSQVSPSVTTTATNDLLLCFIAASPDQSGNYTAPAGMTKAAEVDVDVFSTHALFTQVPVDGTSGTGTRTATFTASEAYASYSIAIRSLAASGSTPATASPTGAAIGMAAGSPTAKAGGRPTATVASIGTAANAPAAKAGARSTATVASVAVVSGSVAVQARASVSVTGAAVGMAAGSPVVRVSRTATALVASIGMVAGSATVHSGGGAAPAGAAIGMVAGSASAQVRVVPIGSAVGIAANAPTVRSAGHPSATGASVGMVAGTPSVRLGQTATPTAALVGVVGGSPVLHSGSVATPIGAAVSVAALSASVRVSAHPVGSVVGMAANQASVTLSATAVAQQAPVVVDAENPTVFTGSFTLVYPIAAAVGMSAGSPSPRGLAQVSAQMAAVGVVAGTAQPSAGSGVLLTAAAIVVVSGVPTASGGGGASPDPAPFGVAAQNPSVQVGGNASVSVSPLLWDIHAGSPSVSVGGSANPVPVVASIGVGSGSVTLSIGSTAPARVASVVVNAGTPTAGLVNGAAATYLLAGALGRLSPSWIEVLEQRATRINGSVRVSWEPVVPAIRLQVRFDLNFTRKGKDQQPFMTAPGTPERMGLLFADNNARPYLRAGVRVRTVSGPVQGIFDVRQIPDNALGFGRAHHLEVEVHEVAQRPGGSHVAPQLVYGPSRMRHLYASRVELYELIRETGTGTSPTGTWTKVTDMVDPLLGVAGEMKCRLDLGFIRPGRDTPAQPVAGRALDRVGVLFCDLSPYLRAGMRVRCVQGDVYGMFEIRVVPDLSPDMNAVRHIEVQVVECAQSLSGMVSDW